MNIPVKRRMPPGWRRGGVVGAAMYVLINQFISGLESSLPDLEKFCCPGSPRSDLKKTKETKDRQKWLSTGREGVDLGVVKVRYAIITSICDFLLRMQSFCIPQHHTNGWARHYTIIHTYATPVHSQLFLNNRYQMCMYERA